jgi:glycosyltransferase involved in cell wall biosynthesis
MASSLPIVASRVGGTPEILKDGETGFLIAPADPDELNHACKKILDDASLSRRFGIAARKAVTEKFDIQLQVDKLINLFSEVIYSK